MDNLIDIYALYHFVRRAVKAFGKEELWPEFVRRYLEVEKQICVDNGVELGESHTASNKILSPSAIEKFTALKFWCRRELFD